MVLCMLKGLLDVHKEFLPIPIDIMLKDFVITQTTRNHEQNLQPPLHK